MRGAVLAVLLATGAAFAPAGAQTGEMRASLTILEPVRSIAPGASTLSMSRGGVMSVNTGSPVAGPTSQILMVNVVAERGAGDSASSAPLRVVMRSGGSERVLAPGVAVPVGRDGLAPASGDDFRVSYDVRLGARPNSSAAPVRLDVRYLAVPGT